MCWQSITAPIKLTAEFDLPILKVGFLCEGEGMVSPIRFFHYDFNKVYNVDHLVALESPFYGYSIHVGLHSYDPRIVSLCKTDWSVLAAKGHIKIQTYAPGCKIFEGFIPKGAHYCSNLLGELVSDAIVITNKKK